MKKRGKIFSKRGLSEVIVSIIMVLLVLVAIGIVWVVVKNLISSGEEGVNLGFVTTSLKIENVKVNDENVEVRIKREAGEGEVSGLKFMIDDGVESQTFTENIAIKGLETKSITLNYSGLIREVSVSPIFKTESGKEKVGNVVDTYKSKFIGLDILEQDYGLVSWWRLEDNADDELGGNDGDIVGNANCDVDGKYGKACKFDGDGDYINIEKPIPNNLQFEKAITLSAWVNPLTYDVLDNVAGIIASQYDSDRACYSLSIENRSSSQAHGGFVEEHIFRLEMELGSGQVILLLPQEQLLLQFLLINGLMLLGLQKLEKHTKFILMGI